MTRVLSLTVEKVDSIVISSQEKRVYDVGKGHLGHTLLRAGRGYLEGSSTQDPGRFGVRPTGGGARLAA